MALATRWRGRAFLSLLDQGLTSVSNFALTILCAAWLPLDDFGRYVIVWAVSLFVENVAAALITDPLPALVSRVAGVSRNRVGAAAFWVVLIYAALSSLLLFAILPIVWVAIPAFALPLACLGVVNPLQRLQFLSRRLCYIQDRLGVAALTAFISGLVLIGGAYALHSAGALTVATAILLWGFASAAALVVTTALRVGRIKRTRSVHVKWLAMRLWRSGRWLAGATVAFWLGNQGVLPLVAFWEGTQAAGILRALQNLFTPIIQVNAAANLVLLPRAADNYVHIGKSYLRTLTTSATMFFTLLTVAYCSLVLIDAKDLIGLVYRKLDIIGAAHLLWPLAVAATIDALRQGLALVLLVTAQTRAFFGARIGGVAIFFAAILLLDEARSLNGIVWVMVVANAAVTLAIVPTVLGLLKKQQ